MIRGSAAPLSQRTNQHGRPQIPPQNSRSQRTSTIVAKSKRKPKTDKKRIEKDVTFEELTESLEEWTDLTEEGDFFQAKDKIIDCSKSRSENLILYMLYLSSLPDVIGRMQHIQQLSISNNYFSELPEILANLMNLELLDMSNNVLKEVPDYIRKFRNLKFFNAECNQINKVSEELGRLPKLQRALLAHNRILRFPRNIHKIKHIDIDDQVPPASFSKFSTKFAKQWQENIQHEIGSGCFEIWFARYEEILRLPGVKRLLGTFKKRIGRLLDDMADNPNFREHCYYIAQDVISTCYDGILFSLFKMEIKQIEEKIIVSTWSDDEIRHEIECVFNFYSLKEFAASHAAQHSHEEVDVLETALFFYISPENILEMPMGGEKLDFMRNPELSLATDNDVKKAVKQIQKTKEEPEKEYLIDFILGREFWIQYLGIRYAEILLEHTQIFQDQLEILDAENDKINEYDYLKQANIIANEKNDSERKLYRQLTKNIIID